MERKENEKMKKIVAEYVNRIKLRFAGSVYVCIKKYTNATQDFTYSLLSIIQMIDISNFRTSSCTRIHHSHSVRGSNSQWII